MDVHHFVPRPPRPIALTIAGFDPSSGAGITADLKTLAAHGIYGVAAITALTVQSTLGVRAIEPVAPPLLRETLECLIQDVTLVGIKIGMLSRADLTIEVERFLQTASKLRATTVLDPVLRSSSGADLLDAPGQVMLRERLLGMVGWVTPNVEELAVLSGCEVRAREQVPAATAKLAGLAAQAGNTELHIVVTGGHLAQPDDYLFAAGQGSWIAGQRVETTSTHGTGCAFSTALLAALIAGRTGVDAVAAAKDYVSGALRAAYPVGRGRGPMHHLFAQDRL